VNDQLTLPGFDIARVSQQDDPAFFRRKSDRGLHSAATRNPASSEFHSSFASVENAVWPVRIFTLGRFNLLYQGQPLDYARKVPHRPLVFLKTVVALGGRDISASSIASMLWPETDGDNAQRSFDTTLYRLRKMLADDRILILRDGKVSLDPRYCWVDVWSFERLLGTMQRIRSRDTTGRDAYQLDQLMQRILSLYQDHFLAREEATAWSVSLRERLRSKFIHCLLDIGHYWEIHGFWGKAIQCYQKGLEADDLIEVFYQRLMVCMLQTHRISEGMAVYRRCRQILSIVLGLQPEPETESIYLSLKKARLQKQSA
jgi:LuxR family maltose regulon positive regulatory protein